MILVFNICIMILFLYLTDEVYLKSDYMNIGFIHSVKNNCTYHKEIRVMV
jgi:hypothetical protein